MPAPYDYAATTGYARTRADWADFPSTTTPITQTQLDQFDQAIADLKGVVTNVKDFLAKGDGSTNDTTAIANAYTAAPTGSTLYFPRGTYMTDTFNVQKSLNLVGDGPGASIIKNRGTTGQHLVWVRANDVNVRFLTIDGNRTGQGANHSGTALVVGEAATQYNNFSVQGCEIKASGFSPFAMIRVRGARVIGNYLWDNWDTCCDILENSLSVTVANNVIVSGGKYGITTDSPTLAACKNITVRGNTIRMLSAVNDASTSMIWGIALLAADGWTISGNTVDCSAAPACSGGIRSEGSSVGTRLTISNNVVLGGSTATDAGISLDGNTNQDKRAVVAGNVVTGFTATNAAGIRNNVAKKISVIGNNVSNCYYGINADKSATNIADYVVSENIVDGGTVPIRFGVGSGGTGSAIVSNNSATGGSFANWGIDANWTIYYSGPPRVSPSIDAAAIIVEQSTDTGSVASATTTTLPVAGRLITISGTTTITSITASWVGREVVLKFSGALTLTDGSNLQLAGNFVTTADDTISLICDGTNWIEKSRSVN